MSQSQMLTTCVFSFYQAGLGWALFVALVTHPLVRIGLKRYGFQNVGWATPLSFVILAGCYFGISILHDVKPLSLEVIKLESTFGDHALKR